MANRFAKYVEERRPNRFSKYADEAPDGGDGIVSSILSRAVPYALPMMEASRSAASGISNAAVDLATSARQIGNVAGGASMTGALMGGDMPSTDRIAQRAQEIDRQGRSALEGIAESPVAPTTGVGQFISEAIRFGGKTAGAAMATKGIPAGAVTRGAIAGAMADATEVPTQNLGNLIESATGEGTIPTAIREGDSPITGRIKNIAEGGILGGAADLALRGATKAAPAISRTVGGLAKETSSFARSEFGSIMDRVAQSGKAGPAATRMARQAVGRAKGCYGAMANELDRVKRLSGRPIQNLAELKDPKEIASNMRGVRDLADEISAETPDGIKYNLSKLHLAGEERIARPEGRAGEIVDAVRDLVKRRGEIFEQRGVQQMTKDGPRPFTNPRGEDGSILTPKVMPRVMTSEFHDILMRGAENSPAYEPLVRSVAHANNMEPDEVAKIFSSMREEAAQIGELPDSGLRRSQIEFQRELDVMPSSIEVDGQRVPLMETNPYHYAERLAQTGSGRLGVIDVFGQDIDGDGLNAARKRFVERGGDAEEFNMMVRALHGSPVEKPWVDPSSAWGKTIRGAQYAMRPIRSALLSASAIVNIPEPLGNVRAFGGNRNTAAALKDLLSSKDTTVAMLEGMGAINRDIADFSIDPKRIGESVTRIVSNFSNRAALHAYINEFQEALAAQVAFRKARQWQQGIWKSGDIVALRGIGFDRGMARRIVTGKASMEVYDDVVRRAPAELTAGNMRAAELSAWEHRRIVRATIAFQRYAMMKMRNFAKVTAATADEIQRSVKTGDFKAGFGAMKKWADFQLGTAASGASAFLLAQLVLGGTDSFKQKLVEAGVLDGDGESTSIDAVDRAERLARFIGQSWWYSSVGGPFGQIARYMGNETGSLDDLAKGALPYFVVRELTDATTGKGRYKDYSAGDPRAYIKMMENLTPATRVADRGLAAQVANVTVFGGDDFRKMRNATSAYWRWRMENDPVAGGYRRRTEQEEQFYKSMRQAYRAMTEGDQDTFYRKLYDAYGASKEGKKSITSSLRSRKLLNGLTQEQQAGLINAVGTETAELILAHDQLIQSLIDNLPEQ